MAASAVSSPFNLTLREYEAQLHQAAAYVSQHLPPADVALVLGSGLQDFERQLHDTKVLNYSDIPGMPRPKVSGHPGRFISGLLPSGRRIYCLAGRSHPYEGYPAYVLAYPPLLLSLLGVRVFIATNAAGGAKAHRIVAEGAEKLFVPMMPGNLMVITDHVNVMRRNPLEELAVPLGPVYVAGRSVHSERLIGMARKTALELTDSVTVFEGTYASFPGPTYETADEVEVSMAMGVHAFGMSTVPDLLIAAACGLECMAISLITNQAAGVSGKPLSHEEVTQTGLDSAKPFETFISCLISAIPVQANLHQASLPSPLLSCTDNGLDSKILPDFPSSPTAQAIEQGAAFLRQQLQLNGGAEALKVLVVGPPHVRTTADLQELTGDITWHRLRELPGFRATSPAGYTAIYGLQSSNGLLVILTNDHLGFSAVEAVHLAELLAELKAAKLVLLISAGSQSPQEIPVGTILSVPDIFDSTTILTVCPQPEVHRWTTAPLLSSAASETLPTHACMFFGGPSFPSPSELQMARASGVQVSSITRSSIISAVASAGIHVQLLASIDYDTPVTQSGEPVAAAASASLSAAFSRAIASPSTSPFSSSSRLPLPDTPQSLIHHRLARPVFQGDPAFVASQADAIRSGLLHGLDSCPPVLLVERSLGSELPGFTPSKHHDIPLSPDYAAAALSSRLSLGTLTGFPSPVLLLQAAPSERSGLALGLLMTPARVATALKPPLVVSLLRVTAPASSGLGPLLALSDHINLCGRNPLFGSNVAEWGDRFFDVQTLYGPSLLPLLKASIQSLAPATPSSAAAGVVLYAIGPLFQSHTADSVLGTFRCAGWATANIPEHLVLHHGKTALLALGLVDSSSSAPDLALASSVVARVLSQRN